jgi:hypothetical protein
MAAARAEAQQVWLKFNSLAHCSHANTTRRPYRGAQQHQRSSRNIKFVTQL